MNNAFFSNHKLVIHSLFIYCTVFAAFLGAILWLNQGLFVFVLDDPYIHLALAENLMQGHYGVNIDEYASSSSSILWPILIAPLTLFERPEYLILLLNFLAGIATLICFSTILRSVLDDESALKFMAMLIILFNLVGIHFTGMEHSLQILCVALLFKATLMLYEDNKIPNWIFPLLIIAPLIRYENTLFCFGFALLAFSRRYFLGVILAGMLAMFFIAAQSYYWHSLGLPLLPSSIMTKTQALGTNSHFLSSLIGNILRNIKSPGGLTLLILLGLIIKAALNTSRENKERIIAGIFIVIACLHFMLFRFGWYARYELYILFPYLLFIIYLYPSICKQLLNHTVMRIFLIIAFTLPIGFVVFKASQQHITVVSIVCLILAALIIYKHHQKSSASTIKFLTTSVLLFLFVAPYWFISLLYPIVSHNVYHQQYQMHRFVTQYYQKPVAINDLGLVSYRNSNYVLDLWGLAYYPSAVQRLSNTTPDWMNEMTERHEVGMVMIYASEFVGIPKPWVEVARLHDDFPLRGFIPPNVQIFATHKDAIPEIMLALSAFNQQSPPDVKMQTPGGLPLSLENKQEP